MENAKGVVFLVTPEFLTSTYINEKELASSLQRAAENELKIFWILCEDCDFDESPLAKLQAAHSTREDLYKVSSPKRNSKIKEICKRIKDTIA